MSTIKITGVETGVYKEICFEYKGHSFVIKYKLMPSWSDYDLIDLSSQEQKLSNQEFDEVQMLIRQLDFDELSENGDFEF